MSERLGGVLSSCVVVMCVTFFFLLVVLLVSRVVMGDMSVKGRHSQELRLHFLTGHMKRGDSRILLFAGEI